MTTKNEVGEPKCTLCDKGRDIKSTNWGHVRQRQNEGFTMPLIFLITLMFFIIWHEPYYFNFHFQLNGQTKC